MNLCFHGSERNVWSLYVTAWIEQWRPNSRADVRAYARDLRPIQRVNARHVHPLTAVAAWIRDPRHDWSCGRVWVVMLCYNSPCILLTWHILLLSAQLYSSCTRYMSSCSCIARYVISIPRHVIHLFSIKPFQSGTQWHCVVVWHLLWHFEEHRTGTEPNTFPEQLVNTARYRWKLLRPCQIPLPVTGLEMFLQRGILFASVLSDCLPKV